MIAHRRHLLLHHLGIQQWVARDVVAQPIKASLIWRDECDASKWIEKSSTQDEKIPVARIEKQDDTNPVEMLDSVEPSAMMQPVDVQDLQFNPFTNTIQFQIQCCRHQRFLLLADVKNEQQQQLWLNIQQACHLVAQPLTWPPEVMWSVYDDLIPYYFQGLKLDHNQQCMIFCLGEIHGLSDLSWESQQFTWQTLPTLAECLSDVQAKRQVWHTISPYLTQA